MRILLNGAIVPGIAFLDANYLVVPLMPGQGKGMMFGVTDWSLERTGIEWSRMELEPNWRHMDRLEPKGAKLEPIGAG